MDRIRDLCDLAQDVNESLESLIRFGALGELTIHVIAHNWPIRSNGDTQKTAKGPVFLLPDDLHQSLNAEFTTLTQIRRPHDDGPRSSAGGVAGIARALAGPLRLARHGVCPSGRTDSIR